MAVAKRLFHHHDSRGDEDWYYLARDTENGKIWIEHEWEYGNVPRGKDRTDLADFLTQTTQGTKQDNLLRLIGTLANE